MNLPSRHRLRNAVCLMTAGIAHALTFAPGPLPASLLPLVQMLSLTILAYATINAANARQAWLRGWLFGLSSFALGLYWLFISMHVYGHLAAPLAVLGVLALSAFLALFGATACALSRKLSAQADAQSKLGACRLALSWAACWAGFEWLRATLFTGFPWLNIGYAHVDSPLAGWAPVLGVHGMAMLAALLAAALACWLQTDRRQALPLLLAILLCLIGLPLSRINWAQASGAPMHVRLVQGNIEQAQKFNGNQTEQNLLQHMNLAALPVTDAPDPTLIVLPETVLPVFQDRLKPEVWEIWQRIAAERKAIIVMGAPLHDIHAGQDRYTNSVIGLTAHTTAEELYAAQGAMRYDKRHLVPWGEYVPPGFRWFVNMLDIPLGNFDRGQERQAPFAIGDQRVAFNICYEDLFGNELLPALQSVDGEPGASILINVSNLGWFGDSWALRQHLQIARLRTIETARPMLTATNTGITAAIEPTGRVAASLPPHQAGILPVTVQGMSGLTPYARFGDKLALALIGLSLIIVITLGRRGRRQK